MSTHCKCRRPATPRGAPATQCLDSRSCRCSAAVASGGWRENARQAPTVTRRVTACNARSGRGRILLSDNFPTRGTCRSDNPVPIHTGRRSSGRRSSDDSSDLHDTVHRQTGHQCTYGCKARRRTGYRCYMMSYRKRPVRGRGTVPGKGRPTLGTHQRRCRCPGRRRRWKSLVGSVGCALQVSTAHRGYP